MPVRLGRRPVANSTTAAPVGSFTLASSVALIAQRRDGFVGATTVAGGIPLQQGRVTAADITARTQRVIIGDVEQAIYCAGLGRYPDGSYRSLYVEFFYAFDLTVPMTGVLLFDHVRGKADIAATVLDATWGFCDPVTHLPFGGTTATGWMKNPANFGRNAAIVAPSDPTYIAPIFGVLPRTQWTTLGMSVMAPTYGTKTFAQQAQTFIDRFDTYCKGGTAQSMWDSLDSYGFIYGSITNAAFFGANDLTNAANDPGAAATPAYFAQRYYLGNANETGANYHYYDQAHFQILWWAATGDLAYYARGCAYAFCYRYYQRWLTNAGAVSPFPDGFTSKIHESCPEGMKDHYLLTGDPESLFGLQTQASHVDVAHLAMDGFYMGEPRPVGRGLKIVRCAWEASTSANETQSWQTALNTAIENACNSGTGRYPVVNSIGRSGITFRTNAVNFLGPPGSEVQYCGGTGSNTFVTPFQHMIVADELELLLERASLTATQRTQIRNTHLGIIDALYPDYFRGDNEQYVTPRVACFIDADGSLNYPGPINILPCQMLSNYSLAGGTGISPYVDTANMFPPAFAAAALNAADIGQYTRAQEYRALSERFFIAAVGTTAGGELGPNLDGGSTNSFKARKEQYCFSIPFFQRLRLAAPAGPILGATIASYVSASITSGNASGLVGAICQATGSTRDNTHFPMPIQPTTWSAVSSNPAVVQVTSVVGRVATLTYMGVGSATVTMTETTSGIAAPAIALTVTAAQQDETWSTGIVRPAIWDTTIAGSGITPDASSTTYCQIELTAGGTSQIEDHVAYDLTTVGALANGVVVDLSLITGAAQGFVLLMDATGKGFGFHYDGGAASLEVGRTTGFAFSSSSSVAYSATNHRYMRLRQVGVNIELDVSSDGSTWNNRIQLAFSTEVLTAMKRRCYVNAGGAAMVMRVGRTTFY